ncbi:MAG: hypothetical protein QUS09_08025, partial [Methanotrichaceae archaeon]|nr:hypothetical protein [Methanotrichaceae archaeon]
MEIDGLLKAEDITMNLINAKASPYRYCTVSPGARAGLEDEGWQFVPTKLRKSIRMRKPKDHADAFEDRVWAM